MVVGGRRVLPLGQTNTHSCIKRHTCMVRLNYSSRSSYLRSPVVSILEAVLTVSPNRQYRGIVSPTTPATQEPISVN